MKSSFMVMLVVFAYLLTANIVIATTTVPTAAPITSFKTLPSPKALIFVGNEIWVTSLLNKSAGVSVFSYDDNRQSVVKISDINLNNGGGVEVLHNAKTGKVYVSQMESGKIFEIDATTKKITRSFNTKSTWTKYMALSPDSNTLYASNWVSNTISEIDLVTGKLKRNIKAVRIPRGIYPTQDGKYLYVAGFDKGEIQKINLTTGMGTVVYKSGGAMRHIVADEARGVLFVSDMGKHVIWKVILPTTVVGVNGTTTTKEKVELFAKTDKHPNTIALSPDKNMLIVSNRGTNYSSTDYYQPGPDWGSIMIFDTYTGDLLKGIAGGNQPTALDAAGSLFAYSDFLDNKVTIFKIPSYVALKNSLATFGKDNIYEYRNTLKKTNFKRK